MAKKEAKEDDDYAHRNRLYDLYISQRDRLDQNRVIEEQTLTKYLLNYSTWLLGGSFAIISFFKEFDINYNGCLFVLTFISFGLSIVLNLFEQYLSPFSYKSAIEDLDKDPYREEQEAVKISIIIRMQEILKLISIFLFIIGGIFLIFIVSSTIW